MQRRMQRSGTQMETKKNDIQGGVGVDGGCSAFQNTKGEPTSPSLSQTSGSLELS